MTLGSVCWWWNDITNRHDYPISSEGILPNSLTWNQNLFLYKHLQIQNSVCSWLSQGSTTLEFNDVVWASFYPEGNISQTYCTRQLLGRVEIIAEKNPKGLEACVTTFFSISVFILYYPVFPTFSWSSFGSCNSLNFSLLKSKTVISLDEWAWPNQWKAPLSQVPFCILLWNV